MSTASSTLDDVRAQLAPTDKVLKAARDRRGIVLAAAEKSPGTLRSYNSGSIAHGTANSDLDAGTLVRWLEEGMSKKSDRHVVPSRHGGWDVVAPGGQRVSSHHDTQHAAIDRAREIVRHEGGGEVVIHDRRNLIRDSDTVAPGRDPYPPRDRR